MKNAMVIVEPRKHHYLKKVCHNFDQNMPSDWDLYVVHGKSHKKHAEDSVKGITRNVFFIPLSSNNLLIYEYNALFKTLDFWNKIKAENILVFQTDAALCSKSKFDINDFIKYDYIGCPYNNSYKKGVWTNQYKDSFFYGIGGLSFRKKSFMQKCIKENPVESDYPEDVFFSNCVESSNKKPKSLKVLQKFCTQNKFTRKSFGSHKTRSVNKQSFYKYCPEAIISKS